MAKDQNISIVIRARNMVAAGFKGVVSAAKNLRDKVGASLAGVANIAKTTTDGLYRLAKRGSLAFGAISASVVAAMREAETFNKQIALITTLSSYSIGEAARDVRKLAAEFGLAKDELTKGLYDALSAGVPKENAFEFMRVASRAAVAGATSVAAAVSATTRIIDAYNLTAAHSEAINDKMFTAVKYGVVTYDEIANKIGSVAGVAQKAGISLDDLMAVVATASKTVSSERLFTGMRSAIIALAKTAEGSALITEKGLGGALAEVSRATGGTLFGLRKVIQEVQALPVALAVSGANAEKYSENLRNMTTSANAMSEAFKKADEVVVLGKLQSALHNMILVAGDAALKTLGPTIQRAADAAQRFSEKIATWVEGEKVKALARDIDSIVAAIGGDDAETKAAVVGALGDVIKAAFYEGGEAVYKWIKKAFYESTGVKKAKEFVKRETDVQGFLENVGLRIMGVKKSDPAPRATPKLTLKDAMGNLARVLDKAYDAAEKRAVKETASAPPGDLITATAAEVDPYDTYEQEKERIEQIAKEKKKRAEEEKKLRKELAEEEKRIARETANEKKRLLDEQLAKAKEIADKSIRAYIEERRAKRLGDADDAKIMRQAQALQNKARFGYGLSQREQDKLGAYQDIMAARQAVPGLEADVQRAQSELDALTEQGKTLADIKQLLADNLEKQQALSKMG